MDDISYTLGMDPVEFTLKNMLRPTAEQPFTNYSLDACIQMGADTFDWQARRQVIPGSDAGPLKRGAGFSFMMFRAAVGTSSAIVQVDARQSYTVFVGVTDVGPGAKTTMGMIAAEAVVYDLFREFSGLTFQGCLLFGRLTRRDQIPKHFTPSLALKHPNITLFASDLLVKSLQEVRRADQRHKRPGKVHLEV